MLFAPLSSTWPTSESLPESRYKSLKHMHKLVGSITPSGLFGRDKLTRPCSTQSPIAMACLMLGTLDWVCVFSSVCSIAILRGKLCHAVWTPPTCPPMLGPDIVSLPMHSTLNMAKAPVTCQDYHCKLWSAQSVHAQNESAV
jgi:hypothetical protein